MPFVPSDLPVQPLFARGPLAAIIQTHVSRTQEMVDGVDSNELLVTPVNDLVNLVIAHNGIHIPVLLEGQAQTEIPDEFWHAQDFNGHAISGHGFRYQLTIPFSGNSDLFFLTPEKEPGPRPVAKIFQRQLFIRVAGIDLTQDEVQAEIARILASIKSFLSSQSEMITPFMRELESEARNAVIKRKERILASRKIAASLGYPLRRRGDDFVNHISTDVGRRMPARQPPRNNVDAFTPEPALDEKEYQHILKVLSDMTLVMERAPTAFKNLYEEDFRDFFIAVLNTHYEGNATGETFNKAGKTDILIRDNGRNVFIAECKIWRGAKGLSEAIDQLLSYLSWRDTKAAVIIFNRNQDFSHILSEIQRTLQNHPHKKFGPKEESKTRFRSVFGLPTDYNREVFLTVMAFDVPTSAPAPT